MCVVLSDVDPVLRACIFNVLNFSSCQLLEILSFCYPASILRKHHIFVILGHKRKQRKQGGKENIQRTMSLSPHHLSAEIVGPVVPINDQDIAYDAVPVGPPTPPFHATRTAQHDPAGISRLQIPSSGLKGTERAKIPLERGFLATSFCAYCRSCLLYTSPSPRD